MQTTKNTFCKEERLKSRKIINELFDRGKIIHHYPFKVLYQAKTKEKEEKYLAQIAISVSKKNFKHAVDRNYIKRKIREAYRISKHELYNNLSEGDQKLHFFVIYTAKDDLDFSLIEQEMKSLIKKINHKSLNKSKQ